MKPLTSLRACLFRGGAWEEATPLSSPSSAGPNLETVGVWEWGMVSFWGGVTDREKWGYSLHEAGKRGAGQLGGGQRSCIHTEGQDLGVPRGELELQSSQAQGEAVEKEGRLSGTPQLPT